MKNTTKVTMLLLIIAFYVTIISSTGCNKESAGPGNKNINITEYTIDETDFPNPERGFYGQQLSDSKSPSPLWAGYFDQLRDQNITLIRRLYSMTTFRTDPITEDYLQHIQDDMDMLRNNGFKIVLRFAYTFNEPEPHNDALPKSRAVAVRYQQAKKDIYGTDIPIGPAEAYDQSNRSRTRHHNDGFASPYNTRDLELVLRSRTTNTIHRMKIEADPRQWLPDDGEIIIRE